MVDPELNLEEVDFFDPEISECPYSAYKVLRDQAPVWHDNVSGMFVITCLLYTSDAADE